MEDGGKKRRGLSAYGICRRRREKAKQLIRNEFGVDGWYHIGYYPGGAYAFYDTKEALATEINIKDNQDNRAIIAELLKNLK